MYVCFVSLQCLCLCFFHIECTFFKLPGLKLANTHSITSHFTPAISPVKFSTHLTSDFQITHYLGQEGKYFSGNTNLQSEINHGGVNPDQRNDKYNPQGSFQSVETSHATQAGSVEQHLSNYQNTNKNYPSNINQEENLQSRINANKNSQFSGIKTEHFHDPHLLEYVSNFKPSTNRIKSMPQKTPINHRILPNYPQHYLQTSSNGGYQKRKNQNTRDAISSNDLVQGVNELNKYLDSRQNSNIQPVQENTARNNFFIFNVGQNMHSNPKTSHTNGNQRVNYQNPRSNCQETPESNHQKLNPSDSSYDRSFQNNHRKSEARFDDNNNGLMLENENSIKGSTSSMEVQINDLLLQLRPIKCSLPPSTTKNKLIDLERRLKVLKKDLLISNDKDNLRRRFKIIWLQLRDLKKLNLSSGLNTAITNLGGVISNGILGLARGIVGGMVLIG